MRKTLGILGTSAVVAASVFAIGGTAQAAAPASCTLVQSEIYNGANIIQWVTGLEGCSGDVNVEVQSQAANGSWSVWSSDTTHYDNNESTFYGDVDLPCMLRVHASFGSQSFTTQAARNNNCGGGF